MAQVLHGSREIAERLIEQLSISDFQYVLEDSADAVGCIHNISRRPWGFTLVVDNQRFGITVESL